MNYNILILFYVIRPSVPRGESPTIQLNPSLSTTSCLHLLQVFLYSIHPCFPGSSSRSSSNWHRIVVFGHLPSLIATTYPTTYSSRLFFTSPIVQFRVVSSVRSRMGPQRLFSKLFIHSILLRSCLRVLHVCTIQYINNNNKLPLSKKKSSTHNVLRKMLLVLS